MIEAGLKAREACNFHGTDERKQVAEIYRYMHEAGPQSAASSPDADLVERVARAIAPVIQKPLNVVATAAIEALTATAPPSDSECPTCQGRGEMWAFVQGLGRAPDPVQCDDCHGTGKNSDSDAKGGGA
jgi:hypothetical protein